MESNATAGCIAEAATTVEVINPTGGENQKIYPCFEHQTMPDLLPSTFTWRYYAPERRFDLDSAQCDSAHLRIERTGRGMHGIRMDGQC